MNKILSMKFGSHLYGTNTPNSDTDIKGIYLPTAREIVLNSYQPTIQIHRNKAQCERNTKDDVDQEFFSLDRFLELLCEGQTVALDLLFGYREKDITILNGSAEDPYGLYYSSLMAEIYDNRHLLITSNVCAFIGYARQQAAKYGIKGSRMDALKRTDALLTSILDRGSPYTRLSADWVTAEIETLIKETEALVTLEKTPLIETLLLLGPSGDADTLHLRVNGRSIPYTATVKYAKEIVGKMLQGYGDRAKKAHLAGGKDYKSLSHAVRVNTEAQELLTTGYITFPRPDRELLVKIKTGQIPYEEVAEIIEQGLADLYVAQARSTLRDTPDKEWVDNFVYDVYSDIVRRS